MFKKIAGALALTASTTLTFGAPITVTQVFSDVDWNDYGVKSGFGYGQKVTGNWLFKGVVDTAAANEYPWPGIVSYRAAVTLTQASLGLFEQPILNLDYIYFYPNQVGFANTSNIGAPWTLTRYYDTRFPAFTTFPVSGDTAMPISTYAWNGFGPQWDGFTLSNGARIHGWGTAGSSTVSFSSVSPVHEPSSILMLLLGLSAVLYAVPIGRPPHV